MVEQVYEPQETVCGARNEDYITIDAEKYKVQSVTETFLVRLLNSDGELEKWGQAELERTVAEANRVVVDHVRDYNVEEVTSSAFHAELLKFEMEEPEKAAFLTVPIEKDATFYMVPNHHAGFAVADDGELLALFNNSEINSLGERLIERAIDKGATWLFSFDTKLTDIYRRHRFVETDRGGWDEDEAPDNWNYDKYGRPDVVWLELDR